MMNGKLKKRIDLTIKTGFNDEMEGMNE